MTSAEEIKSLRKKLKVTQAGLADLMGVDQGTVSNWELGKTEPTGPASKLLDNLAATAPEPEMVEAAVPVGAAA